MFRRRAFTHHHIGESRLAPVYGQQFVLPNGLEFDCRPKTGSELPNGNATFRRKVAHHKMNDVASKVGDVSPKHHIAARQFRPCVELAICVAELFGIRLPAEVSLLTTIPLNYQKFLKKQKVPLDIFLDSV